MDGGVAPKSGHGVGGHGADRGGVPDPRYGVPGRSVDRGFAPNSGYGVYSCRFLRSATFLLGEGQCCVQEAGREVVVGVVGVKIMGVCWLLKEKVRHVGRGSVVDIGHKVEGVWAL